MMQPIPPGTESWGERYGVIGVVAILAISALILGLRQFFKERDSDRLKVDEAAKRDTAKVDEAAKREAALNDKIVEIVRESQRETLVLLTKQQVEHETRYQALLERTMHDSRSNAEALRARDAANTEILRSLLRRLKNTGASES